MEIKRIAAPLQARESGDRRKRSQKGTRFPWEERQCERADCRSAYARVAHLKRRAWRAGTRGGSCRQPAVTRKSEGVDGAGGGAAGEDEAEVSTGEGEADVSTSEGEVEVEVSTAEGEAENQGRGTEASWPSETLEKKKQGHHWVDPLSSTPVFCRFKMPRKVKCRSSSGVSRFRNLSIKFFVFCCDTSARTSLYSARISFRVAQMDFEVTRGVKSKYTRV